MTARFNRRWAVASRANLALALTLLTAGSALAATGTPEQRRACTPDVYRLCPGEIPRHHRLPAAAKGQPDRALPGGVRAVRSAIWLARILVNLSAKA